MPGGPDCGGPPRVVPGGAGVGRAPRTTERALEFYARPELQAGYQPWNSFMMDCVFWFEIDSA